MLGNAISLGDIAADLGEKLFGPADALGEVRELRAENNNPRLLGPELLQEFGPVSGSGPCHAGNVESG